MTSDPNAWRDVNGTSSEVRGWRGDLATLPGDLLKARRRYLSDSVAYSLIAWDRHPSLGPVWRRATKRDARYADLQPSIDELIATQNELSRRQQAEYESGA